MDLSFFRSLIGKVGLSSITYLASTTLVLVLNYLLTRLLLPTEYGLYLIFNVYTILFCTLSNLGINYSVIRILHSLTNNNRSKRFVMILGMLSVVFLFSILTSQIYIWLVSRFYSNSFEFNGVMKVFLCIWIIGASIQTLIAEIYRSDLNVKWTAISSPHSIGLLHNFMILVILGLVKLLIDQVDSSYKFDFTSIVITTSLCVAISALVCTVYLIRGEQTTLDLKILSETTFFSSLAQTIQSSIPYLGIGLLVLFTMQSEILILDILLATKDVAIYGACLKVVKLTLFPLTVVNTVLPAYIAKFTQKNLLQDFQNLLSIIVLGTAIPTVIVGIILCLNSSKILSVLYGEFYEIGSTVLIIMIIGTCFSVLSGSAGLVLIHAGYRYEHLLISVVFTVFFVFLATEFARNFGLLGFASAYSIIKISENVAKVIVVRRRIGVWTPIGFNFSYIIGILAKR